MKQNNQIQRVKLKLEKARKKDAGLMTFGAESHQYKLGKPATSKEISNFETKYNIQLPQDYKFFLTEIGNGGIDYPRSVVGNSAAGPNYGIYKLGSFLINALVDTKSGYLENECIIHSKMTESKWDKLCKKIFDEREDKHDDKAYAGCLAKIYAGILIIGFTGCSGYQGIILNGKEKGRVIFVYDENYCPHFAEEFNFLDWYESWLDEILTSKT